MKAWWVEKWLDVLVRAVPEAEAKSHAAYARKAKLLFLEADRGTLTAKIDRGIRKACFVRVALPLWHDAVWEKVLDALASESAMGAALAAGTLPPDLENRLVQWGTTLFPHPVTFRCSECEAAAFCKHLGALWTKTAEVLAVEPLLLLKLRGLDAAEVLDALRHKRRAAPAVVPVPPKPAPPEPPRDFWNSSIIWKQTSLLPLAETGDLSLPGFLREEAEAAGKLGEMTEAIRRGALERLHREKKAAP